MSPASISASSRIFVNPQEFQHDEQHNLGRANGNVYQRCDGVEGVHDGQIMVRLKKKRYIVLDYSIQPTDEDLQIAGPISYLTIPKGAGKTICTTPECTKIGYPVCLFDSEPTENLSLYLRSGLCFTCQRILNEKRRTDRKRPSKSEGGGTGVGGGGFGDESASRSPDGGKPSIIYALGPQAKRFKLNGSTIELENDAIILNGAVEGMKHYQEGYGFQEVGVDLHHMVREAVDNTDRLLHAVSRNIGDGSPASVTAALSSTSNTAIKLESGDSALYRGSVEADDPNGLGDAAASTARSVVAAAYGSSEDINVLCDMAFQSMNKALFLLSQWKAAWDSAVAAANEAVTDPSLLADAVASAAAVVAAGTTETSDSNHQEGPVVSQATSSASADMVSLLLAADKRNEQQDAGCVDLDGSLNLRHMLSSQYPMGTINPGEGQDGVGDGHNEQEQHSENYQVGGGGRMNIHHHMEDGYHGMDHMNHHGGEGHHIDNVHNNSDVQMMDSHAGEHRTDDPTQGRHGVIGHNGTFSFGHCRELSNDGDDHHGIVGGQMADHQDDGAALMGLADGHHQHGQQSYVEGHDHDGSGGDHPHSDDAGLDRGHHTMNGPNSLAFSGGGQDELGRMMEHHSMVGHMEAETGHHHHHLGAHPVGEHAPVPAESMYYGNHAENQVADHHLNGHMVSTHHHMTSNVDRVADDGSGGHQLSSQTDEAQYHSHIDQHIGTYFDGHGGDQLVEDHHQHHHFREGGQTQTTTKLEHGGGENIDEGLDGPHGSSGEMRVDESVGVKSDFAL